MDKTVSKRIIIDLIDGDAGELVIRINAKGNVQIITAEPEAGDPTGSAVLSDPDVAAMLGRFKRYTRTTPCHELAVALAGAGWTWSVPKPAAPGKLSDSYIRWERTQSTGKKVVVYQHSKKLATSNKVPAGEYFHVKYTDKGVTVALAELDSYLQKLS